MKLSRLVMSALCLLSISAHSHAEQTGYEVELIIYEDTTKRYIDSEDWSYNDSLHQTTQTLENEASSITDPEYRNLPWKDAALTNALQKIQDNPGINVLLKKRWRQTGLDRDQAYPLNIEVHKQHDASPGVSQAIAEQTADIQMDKQPDLLLSGQVRLVMSRYLHFEVNLEYMQATDGSVNELQAVNDTLEQAYPAQTYPVVSERRMRSREIHYIDHPLVGILVYATPYKIETQRDGRE